MRITRLMWTKDAIPTSAYRLQLSERVNFTKATQLLQMLRSTGFDAIYLSPFFRSYSSHGYDVIDPNNPDPRLGSREQFDHFVRSVAELGMHLIIDIIPNHMSIRGENLWWQDVLTYGPHSKYAHFFDIDWERGGGKLLLPILAEEYASAVKKITRHNEQLTYGDYHLPLAPHSRELLLGPLQKLLDAQYYQLAYWKDAATKINYRRFFNISELAAICIEDKRVFAAHHQWIIALCKSGKIFGLRVDHPDGLYDPKAYLRNLQKECGLYTIVEKILCGQEKLSCRWAIEGSVGYEYMAVLNALFVDSTQEELFTDLYHDFIGQCLDYKKIVYESKKYFADVEMASELHSLSLTLATLKQDFSEAELRAALTEIVACFPVYRTYIQSRGGVSQKDKKVITIALQQARERNPYLDPKLFDFMEKLLLLQLKPACRKVVLRFQQITAPLMAKGVEDTAFYRYTRLLSLNEVGSDPSCFGISQEAFHQFNKYKQRNWPLSLLASSTHDCKRSEDVRARLNVLSEIPLEWKKMLHSWSALTAEGEKPCKNMEYFIYQTLLGAWPITFERVWPLLLKSLREAKQQTSWFAPDEAYERGVEAFVKKLMHSSAFLASFLPFQEKICQLGKLNSLSMLLLKMGSPGIFDLYQGNEHFLYQLVDPDNRGDLAPTYEQDAKSLFTKRGLCYRREHPELFLQGSYLPLKTTGELIAFARSFQQQVVIVAAGRFFTRYEGGQIHLPSRWKNRHWEDLFSQNELSACSSITLCRKQTAGFFICKSP